ncbi:hypothetical protein [Niabella aurantiaca]|uniref:hypothetical protein n=1 Tax=Niabella aurantiaca TaxID=379900 RepID=UPI000363E51C|nr:hypothetical protein [Niabella aurantiaca]
MNSQLYKSKKMLYRTFILSFINPVLLLLMFSAKIFGQQQPKLYIGMAGLNDLQETYIRQNNLEKAVIFYQKEVTTDGINVNPSLFRKNIERKTSSKSQGIAIIDWEGPAFKALSGSNTKQASQFIEEFIKTLELAKRLRPNLQWGFYGLPLRTFDGSNGNWKQINTRLTPIIKESDIITPSLYMYNVNSRVYNINYPQIERGRGDYLYLNLDYALDLAQKFNKKVYPFIWHKQNSGNNKMALSLIPVDIFKNYYKMITTHTSNGKKVNGVIWWDNSNYYYLNRNRYPAVQKQYQNIRNVRQYDLDVLKKYHQATK